MWMDRITTDPAGLPIKIQRGLEQLSGTAATVLRANSAATRGDLELLAKLDVALADAGATELWYLDAIRARVLWRILTKAPGAQPSKAAEAISIVDEAIAVFQAPSL